MARHEGIEFTNERRVIAKNKAGVPDILLSHDAEFVEPHRLEPGPFVIGELLEG
jgi:hypothetical protein